MICSIENVFGNPSANHFKHGSKYKKNCFIFLFSIFLSFEKVPPYTMCSAMIKALRSNKNDQTDYHANLLYNFCFKILNKIYNIAKCLYK